MTGIGSSIANILQGSNGIDTTAMVTQLVAATREPKQAVLDQRTSLNNARISALASASSSLDTFSTSLADVLKSSSLTGQPASNDPSIVAVSSLPGGAPKGLPAQIEVRQLASSQILESTSLDNAATEVGLGTLTLTTASGAHAITIDSSNNTLSGLADAINNAKAGVTATVVTDNRGSRLVLKGETGDANAFTLTKEATDTADVDLERFTFDGATGGMAKRQDALDSIVLIDGVEMQNDGNVLTDAIPYVRIDLNKAAPGTLVTLATDQPTKTTKDLIGDFVAAYNTLRSALNAASASTGDASTSGALAGDPAIRAITNQLAKLTTTVLASSGTYRTLNDIGVGTNKDGTLKIDTARLDAAIAADPGGVSQMLNPTVSTDSDPGIAAVVQKMRDSLQDENGTLAASKSKYNQLKTDLAKQLTKLDEDMTAYEARLNETYNKMQSQLTAFRATQSYLTQQVALWTNKPDN